MFRINTDKSLSINDQEGKITFISYHHRCVVLLISFPLLISLFITTYIILKILSPFLPNLIPFAVLIVFLIFILLAILLFRLPIKVHIKDDVITIEKFISYKSFHRRQIVSFEVLTKRRSSGPRYPNWQHQLIMRTCDEGDITMAIQPSFREDALEFKKTMDYLEEWLAH